MIKLLSHRGEGTDYSKTSRLTFDEMVETYNACFIVNDSFKVTDITGRLAWREDFFK